MRKLQLNSLKGLAVLLLISTAGLFNNSSLTAQCNSGTIGGSVFEDFAADGIYNGNDQGLAGVTVELFNSSGLVADTQSGADGQFIFNGLNDGDSYRVEFKKPTGYDHSWLGADNRSDVQFVTVPNCDATYGALRSNGGCDESSTMYLTCFVNGEPGKNDQVATIVGLEYGFNQTSSVSAVADKGKTGSIWGLAYNKTTNRLFSSAFVKQYAYMTQHGHDAIFATDLDLGTTQLFAKLSDLGVSAGTLTVSDPTDCAYKAQVGTTGLGAMVISPDGQYLYVVNIYNNSIVRIQTSNPTEDNTLEIPLQALPCNGGNQRLFALKYYDGKLWIGSTCTAEYSKDESKSAVTVVSYDIKTNTFDLEFTTNYIKGFWNNDNASYEVQQWLTDIDFTDDGNMILSLSDRVGHVFCDPNQARSDHQNPDILMVWNDNGNWKLEDNGSAGSLTGSGVNNGQGPGNGEFFGFDYWISDQELHPETALGSILVMPGTNSVVAAVYDPLAAAYSGGLHMYNTQNGSKMSAIQLYGQSYTINFGKSTGFGDIVAACGTPPMEIGNLVWEDTNRDGLQTAGEPSLSGVSVCLYNCDFDLLACTITDASGYYTFNHKTPSTNPNYNGIESDACYYIGLDPAMHDNATNTYVLNGANYGPSMDPTFSGTPGDAVCTNNNSDFIEINVNGASQMYVPILTSGNGESEHCYDLGISRVTNFDLALSKKLVGNTTPRQGDNVQFLITVRNEGIIDAQRFSVTDYLHDGFTFDESLNPGWKIIGDKISFKDNTILPVGQSKSYMVTLGLKIDQGYDYTNIAEISESIDMLGNDDSDVDSTPDDDYTNDAPNEDDIDEDQVKIFDLALISTLENPGREYRASEDVRIDIDVWNQGTLAADAVSVITYQLDGLSFVPALNPDWVFNGTGFVNANVGSVQPGQKKTVSVYFQINNDKTEGILEVYSEIIKASSIECPGAVDFDSYPDSDNTNDKGGVPGTSTDNVLTGNGSVDEDDHDPVQIRLNYLDLALMKTTESSFVSPGDEVEFKITVINQGSQAVKKVTLVDYLPANTTLVSPDWTMSDVTTATKNIEFQVPLAKGESYSEYITLKLDDNLSPQILVNYAEIANVYDVTLAEISGYDIDSHPDSDPTNDIGGVLGQPSDDMVNGDPAMDEDDHDPAGVVYALVEGGDCVCERNATEPGNGWFTRTVSVVAPSYQKWRIFEAVNFYDYSAADENAPDILPEFATGDMSPLITKSDSDIEGMSTFSVTGIQVDGKPFYIRIVNEDLDLYEYPPQDKEPVGPGEACFYDQPSISGEFGVCVGSEVTYMTPFESDCDYEWELLNQEDMVLQQGNGHLMHILWTFEPGLYTLRLTKECEDQCITPVTRTIDLGTTGGQISCVGDINISLGVDCHLEVTPGMIIAGDPDPDAGYEVMLMDKYGNIIPNNVLTYEHLWTKITAKLIDGCSGNSCWANVNVEDKVAPTIDCSPAEVFCHQMENYIPIASDNCGHFEIEMIQETSNILDCNDTYIKEVFRSYKAIDQWGNESEPCTQKIMVKRIPFDSIVFPPDIDDLQCSEAMYDEFDRPDYEQTGVPILDGKDLYPLTDDIYCRIGVSFTDHEVETGGCHREFKRRWVIYEDHCTTGGTDSIHIQTIKIKDHEPPIIYCPEDGGTNNCAPGTLLSVAKEDDLLRTIDPETGATTGSVQMTLEGKDIEGANGMATHPISGNLYIVIRFDEDDNSIRNLATVNSDNGEVTLIGITIESLASIAFDASGDLFGVTGSNGSSTSLYKINTNDASAEYLCELEGEDDGRALGLNPMNGKIYYAGDEDDDAVFVSIDNIYSDPCGVTDVPISSDISNNDAQAITWDVEKNAFLWKYNNSSNEPLYLVELDGTYTELGDMDHQAKGLAYCANRDAMVVSINDNYSCSANVNMPHLHVEDECSEPVTVTMSSGFGPIVNSNGGYITNLPIGLHPITYRASDQCGNFTECIRYVEVRDAQPPVAQCDDDMVISLRSDGTAEAYAGIFDEGSYDNCYIDSMAIRRLDGDSACFAMDTILSEKVNFCCDDIGKLIPLQFTVWDKYGNQANCDLEVLIQDKTAPVVLPIQDLYFECEDFNTIEAVAEETAHNLSVINECGDTTLNIIIDKLSNDVCNDQRYHITYEISDTPPTPGVPNTATVWHYVTVSNTKHFDISTVTFPDDTLIINNMCADIDYSPDALGEPTYNYAGCDLIDIAPHEDHKFVVEDDDNTCFKIVRKWKVINYCTNEERTHDQTIRLVNTEAPIIDSVKVDSIYTSADNCEKGHVIMSAYAIDSCTEVSKLRWEIFIDGNLYNTSLGGTASFDDSLSIGVHIVTFSFTDECSNTISAVREFEVTNNVGPEIACIAEASVGLVPWDTDGDLIADTDYACIGIDSLIASYFHPCDEKLIFSFDPDTDVNDPTTIQDTVCFDCSNRGLNEVFVYVFDEDGQFASCSVMVTVENNSVHTTCSDVDLALTKMLAPGQQTPIELSDEVDFVVTVYNQSSEDVTNIVVEDYIPSNMSFVSSPDFVLDNGSYIATIPNFLGGQIQELEITLSLDSYTNGQRIINNAEIISIDGDNEDQDSPIVLVIGSSDDDSELDTDNDIDDEADGTPGSADNPSDQDDYDPVLLPIVDIALIKEVVTAGPYNYGQEVTFSMFVVNQGTVDLENIEVTDYIPCGFDFIDEAINSEWSFDGVDQATTTITSLAAGEDSTVNVTLELQQCPNADAWLNYAEVSQMFADGVDVSDVDIDSEADNDVEDDEGGVPNSASDDQLDGNGIDDEDDHDPALLEVFDLALTKVNANPGVSYYVGETATFTITIFNQGNLIADGVVVTDYIPAGFSYSSTSDGLGWSLSGGNAVSDPINDLEPGDNVVLTLDLVVESSVGSDTEYCNYAEITAATGDGGLVVDDVDSDIASNTADENSIKPGDPGDNDTDSNGTDGNQDDHDPATVTVCPEWLVLITPDNPEICFGDDVTLTANPSPGNANVEYEWSTGATTQELIVSPAISTSFSVTITNVDNPDCEYTDDVLVTVNPNPDIQAVVTTVNPVCDSENEPVILNVTGAPANATFSWTTTAMIPFTSNLQNPTVTSNALFGHEGTYTVTVTSEEGCESSASVDLTVLDCTCPLMLELTDNGGPYCDGENVNITSNLSGTVGDETFVWTFNGNVVVGQNGPNLTTEIAQTGIYSLTVSSEDSDCEISDFVNVVVNAQPDITAIVTTDNPVCENEGASIILEVTGTIPMGSTVEWTTTAANGFTSNEINPTVTNNADADDDGLYTVVVTFNGCTDEASIAVVTEDCTCPLGLTLTDDGPYCDGENVNITSVLTGGADDEVYQWAFNNVDIPMETSPDLTNVLAQSGTYTLTVSSEMEMCEAVAMVVVTVNDLPDCTAPPTDVEVCEGGELNLSIEDCLLGSTIVWTAPNGDTFNGADINPTNSADADVHDGVWTVEIETTDGCTEEYMVTVNVIIEECPVFEDADGEICFSFTIDENGDPVIDDLISELISTYTSFICSGIDAIAIINDIGCNTSCDAFSTIEITTGVGTVLTCEILLEAEDIVPPLLDCPDDDEIMCDEIEDYKGMFTATDNCNDLDEMDESIECVYNDDMTELTITYTVTDGSGLESTCVRVVTFSDGPCECEDPATIECPDQLTEIIDPECDGEMVDLFNLIVIDDECCPIEQEDLTYTDQNGLVLTPDEITGLIELEPGVHTITITGVDGCGNTIASCMLEIVVYDEVFIRCNKVIIEVDPVDCSITLNVDAFGTGVFSCNASIEYEFDFISFDPNDEIDVMTWGFPDDPEEQNIYFNIYFETIFGPDSCEAIVFLTAGSDNPCDGMGNSTQGVIIGGQIYNELGEFISGTQVDLLGSDEDAIETNEYGFYAFPHMPVGGAYEIMPSKEDIALNGVSTIDLIKIQRHILGNEPLGSAYKMIAADINRSDNVTSIDIIELRKLILGIYTEFPQNTSWRMVDAGHIFADQNNPFIYPIPESYSIDYLTQNMFIDFVGVKIGDVTNNASINLNTDVVDNRAADEVSIEMVTESTGVASTASISIPETNEFLGLQMSLTYDVSELTVQGVEIDESLLPYFGYHINKGTINMSLALGSELDVAMLSDLIKIIYMGESVRPFELSDLTMKAELYELTDTKSIGLEYRDTEQLNIFTVSQNHPNPWTNQTAVQVYMPEAGIVDLEIYNTNGQMVMSKSISLDSGKHVVNISSDELNSTGVFHYKLSTGSSSVIKRFLLIE